MADELKVKDFLKDEILERFDEFRELERGSEEYSRFNTDTCNLIKAYNEIEKMERDTDEKEIRRKIEESMKAEDLKAKRKEKWIDVGVNVGVTCVTMIFYMGLYGIGLKFEESGTFRSKTFTNLYNKIRPPRIE